MRMTRDKRRRWRQAGCLVNVCYNTALFAQVAGKLNVVAQANFLKFRTTPI